MDASSWCYVQELEQDVPQMQVYIQIGLPVMTLHGDVSRYAVIRGRKKSAFAMPAHEDV